MGSEWELEPVSHQPPRPDQHPAILIHSHVLGVNKFVLERLDGLIVQLELQLQGPIGHTATLLQKGEDLRDHGIKVHYRPSTCASVASAPGSQKVMSMARYSSMAVWSSA
jgi:hypothetical protein